MPILSRKPVEKILVWPHRETVEVEPGVKYAPAPVRLAPRFAIVKWMPAGDGTYTPKLFIHNHWLRISDAESLLGIHYSSLYKLVNGGFIRSRRATPNTTEIELESYFEHCKRVEDDPDFWLNRDNLKRFSQALGRNS